MTMRNLVDATGTAWEVFEVFPGSAGRTISRVPEDFRSGWLCFQSSTERRRLAPIPEDWETWDIVQLSSALSTTHGYPRRTPRASEAQLPPRRTSGETSAHA